MHAAFKAVTNCRKQKPCPATFKIYQKNVSQQRYTIQPQFLICKGGAWRPRYCWTAILFCLEKG